MPTGAGPISPRSRSVHEPPKTQATGPGPPRISTIEPCRSAACPLRGRQCEFGNRPSAESPTHPSRGLGRRRIPLWRSDDLVAASDSSAGLVAVCRSSIGTGWAAGCSAALCKAFPTNRVGAPCCRSGRDVSGTTGHPFGRWFGRLQLATTPSSWPDTGHVESLARGLTEILDERHGPAPLMPVRWPLRPGCVRHGRHGCLQRGRREHPRSAAAVSEFSGSGERRPASAPLLRGRVARSEGSGLFAHAGVMP